MNKRLLFSVAALALMLISVKAFAVVHDPSPEMKHGTNVFEKELSGMPYAFMDVAEIDGELIALLRYNSGMTLRVTRLVRDANGNVTDFDNSQNINIAVAGGVVADAGLDAASVHFARFVHVGDYWYVVTRTSDKDELCSFRITVHDEEGKVALRKQAIGRQSIGSNIDRIAFLNACNGVYAAIEHEGDRRIYLYTVSTDAEYDKADIWLKPLLSNDGNTHLSVDGPGEDGVWDACMWYGKYDAADQVSREIVMIGQINKDRKVKMFPYDTKKNEFLSSFEHGLPSGPKKGNRIFTMRMLQADIMMTPEKVNYDENLFKSPIQLVFGTDEDKFNDIEILSVYPSTKSIAGNLYHTGTRRGWFAVCTSIDQAEAPNYAGPDGLPLLRQNIQILSGWEVEKMRATTIRSNLVQVVKSPFEYPDSLSFRNDPILRSFAKLLYVIEGAPPSYFTTPENFKKVNATFADLSSISIGSESTKSSSVTNNAKFTIGLDFGNTDKEKQREKAQGEAAFNYRYEHLDTESSTTTNSISATFEMLVPEDEPTPSANDGWLIYDVPDVNYQAVSLYYPSQVIQSDGKVVLKLIEGYPTPQQLVTGNQSSSLVYVKIPLTSDLFGLDDPYNLETWRNSPRRDSLRKLLAKLPHKTKITISEGVSGGGTATPNIDRKFGSEHTSSVSDSHGFDQSASIGGIFGNGARKLEWFGLKVKESLSYLETKSSTKTLSNYGRIQSMGFSAKEGNEIPAYDVEIYVIDNQETTGDGKLDQNDWKTISGNALRYVYDKLTTTKFSSDSNSQPLMMEYEQPTYIAYDVSISDPNSYKAQRSSISMDNEILFSGKPNDSRWFEFDVPKDSTYSIAVTNVGDIATLVLVQINPDGTRQSIIGSVDQETNTAFASTIARAGTKLLATLVIHENIDPQIEARVVCTNKITFENLTGPDGTIYKVLKGGTTAFVVKGPSALPCEIIIPPTVTLDNRTYNIRGILSNAYVFSIDEVRYLNVRTIVVPEGVIFINKFAFDGYENLECLTLPTTLRVIGEFAFSGCGYTAQAMSTISLPNRLAYIGRNAFSDSPLLSSRVRLPDSLAYIGRDAFNTANIEEFVLSGRNRHFKVIDGMLYNMSGDRLELAPGKRTGSFIAPKTLASLAEGAFEESQMTHFDFSQSAVTSFPKNSFYRSKMKTLLWPPDIQNIGEWAFYYTELEEVDMPDGITSCGQKAFMTSRFLKKAKLSQGLTTVPDDIFSSSYYLAEVTLPRHATRIGASAFHNARLKSIEIPDGVYEIAEGAFQWTGLEQVTLPTSLQVIGDDAFYGCEQLDSISLPYSLKEIGANAFYNCESLKKADLPPYIQKIGDAAFRSTGIQRVHLGPDITDLGGHAFDDCSNLTRVFITSEKGYTTNDYDVIYEKNPDLVVLALNAPQGANLGKWGVPIVYVNMVPLTVFRDESSAIVAIEMDDRLTNYEIGLYSDTTKAPEKTITFDRASFDKEGFRLLKFTGLNKNKTYTVKGRGYIHMVDKKVDDLPVLKYEAKIAASPSEITKETKQLCAEGIDWLMLKDPVHKGNMYIRINMPKYKGKIFQICRQGYTVPVAKGEITEDFTNVKIDNEGYYIISFYEPNGKLISNNTSICTY